MLAKDEAAAELKKKKELEIEKNPAIEKAK
jgi:hypothetical protein